jgi:putative flippase GtrA
VGKKVANKLEVIAIHGGKSRDNTFRKIKKMKTKFPSLKIIDKTDNWEGYAVIKYGLRAAKNDWVFYTDGDAQYHIEEDLPVLVEACFEHDAEVINGFKVNRADGMVRKILGSGYEYFSKLLFDIPIRDTDCDFRLIKRSFVSRLELMATDASVLPEMIKKLEFLGAKFSEVPVSHYDREYGKSNYTAWSLLREKLWGDVRLYFRLRKYAGFSRNERLIKFLAVGMVSIVIQAVGFNLLLRNSTFEPAVDVILADQVAIILAFILNGRFTFGSLRENKISDWVSKFGKYYVTVISSTFIQALVVQVVARGISKNVVVVNLAYVVGSIVAAVWNYLGQSRIVWKKKKSL